MLVKSLAKRPTILLIQIIRKNKPCIRTNQLNNKIKLILVINYVVANLVLIAYASSEGSGEPAHPCSLTRTSTARSYKQ